MDDLAGRGDKSIAGFTHGEEEYNTSYLNEKNRNDAVLPQNKKGKEKDEEQHEEEEENKTLCLLSISLSPAPSLPFLSLPLRDLARRMHLSSFFIDPARDPASACVDEEKSINTNAPLDPSHALVYPAIRKMRSTFYASAHPSRLPFQYINLYSVYNITFVVLARNEEDEDER